MCHFVTDTAFWMIAAYLVAKWSGFYSVLWGGVVAEEGDNDVQRTLFHIAMLGFAVVIALLLYLTVYLPKVKGLSDSSAWPVYCPKVLPTMGVVGIVSYLIFLRSLWPVWGFLAPLISGFQVMAMVMSTQWIPTLGLC